MRGRHTMNLDEMTEEDYAFLRQQIAPIFQMSFNNLSEEEIKSISIALAKVAYEAARQGVNIFDSVQYMVLPLEAKNEYDMIAGAKGHVVDKEKNSAAVQKFLFGED